MSTKCHFALAALCSVHRVFGFIFIGENFWETLTNQVADKHRIMSVVKDRYEGA